ncbi:MAG TPA: multicopper oxidase domain-containing protein [Acidimicrobiia bacterium]|nr:multicopper oxidase domain-containing protein [Acidimicrobiia bacterium]
MLTRREFLKTTALSTAAVMVGPGIMMKWGPTGPVFFQIPGGSLAPGDVDKYVLKLVKPPAMPRSKGSNKNRDKYRIGVRQFNQRVLSPSHPETSVWSYGSTDFPGPVAEGGTFNYPAFTVEATWSKQVQVTWFNQLVDANRNYLPHLLPIDQTLHWANPPGGTTGRDSRPTNPPQGPYTGPVPIVTHVHGAHTSEDSDGYAEAWYLPDADDIPGGYARTGTFFDYFNAKYSHGWEPGAASFKYPNDQPATTLWYHDHTLGMTRANVYAGPAGFWLIRGGPDDVELGYVAPGVGDDPFGEYTEIPIAIQDRSFNDDGSLFYPDNRAFFEGLNTDELQIPFIPDEACDGLPSDVSPIWNPEFFGNTMVVNGRTWPYLEVEQRRYRFRFLNGCNSRFLVLKLTTTPRSNNDGFNSAEFPFWQIGADQGFLPEPAELEYLLMAPAERADVIVDFSSIPAGTEVYLVNDGPDAPFGGISVEDLSDWESTGQVMKFLVKVATSVDHTTPPDQLLLPPVGTLSASTVTRHLSLNEEKSSTVKVSEDNGSIVLDCENGEAFGPTAALLGVMNAGTGVPLMWSDLISENPDLGSIETWEFHNFTEDAHPIHIHQVRFKVLGRGVNGTQTPEAWEQGFKDTVIAYPGEITRVRAQYDLSGFYVWHCHIVEHEDNEMMRPFHVGPIPSDAPAH